MSQNEFTLALTEDEYNDLLRIIENEHRTQSETIPLQWSPLVMSFYGEENEEGE